MPQSHSIKHLLDLLCLFISRHLLSTQPSPCIFKMQGSNGDLDACISQFMLRRGTLRQRIADAVPSPARPTSCTEKYLKESWCWGQLFATQCQDFHCLKTLMPIFQLYLITHSIPPFGVSKRPSQVSIGCTYRRYHVPHTLLICFAFLLHRVWCPTL
jgi:hypothetical protein